MTIQQEGTHKDLAKYPYLFVYAESNAYQNLSQRNRQSTDLEDESFSLLLGMIFVSYVPKQDKHFEEGNPYTLGRMGGRLLHQDPLYLDYIELGYCGRVGFEPIRQTLFSPEQNQWAWQSQKSGRAHETHYHPIRHGAG